MAAHTDAAAPLDPEKGAFICRVCLACPERLTLRYGRETLLTIKCNLKNLKTLKPYRLLITEEEMYSLRLLRRPTELPVRAVQGNTHRKWCARK